MPHQFWSLLTPIGLGAAHLEFVFQNLQIQVPLSVSLKHMAAQGAVAILHQFWGFCLWLQVCSTHSKIRHIKTKQCKRRGKKKSVEIHVNLGEKHDFKLNQMFQFALLQINKITQWDYIPVVRHKLYLPVIWGRCRLSWLGCSMMWKKHKLFRVL